MPALLQRHLQGAVERLLSERGISCVDGDGWLAIDAAELARGSALGRPRSKIATWGELLAAASSR